MCKICIITSSSHYSLKVEISFIIISIKMAFRHIAYKQRFMKLELRLYFENSSSVEFE